MSAYRCAAANREWSGEVGAERYGIVAQERHTAAFVVGIALGGLVGAGYVLLKTPRSGADLRAGIAARVRGIVDTVKETAGVVGVETRRAGEQTVEKIEATGAAVRDKLPGASGVADLVPGRNRETESLAPTASAAPARPDAPSPAAPERVAAVETGETVVVADVADGADTALPPTLAEVAAAAAAAEPALAAPLSGDAGASLRSASLHPAPDGSVRPG